MISFEAVIGFSGMGSTFGRLVNPHRRF
jgi:hypothetical protein